MTFKDVSLVHYQPRMILVDKSRIPYDETKMGKESTTIKQNIFQRFFMESFLKRIRNSRIEVVQPKNPLTINFYLIKRNVNFLCR